MLELCKEILTKVSFDKALFTKELLKAIGWIKKEELDTFRDWCTGMFGQKYPDVLQHAFARS